MKVAVIFNPVGAEEPVEVVREALQTRGIDAIWLETTEDDPGVGQAQRAVADGHDLIIAVGGDGTVRACAQGVAGTGSVLAIIPSGTGNLLARNLEVPTEPEEALDVALTGETASLDVGKVNDETFTVVAGAGIDAVIMDETSRASKDRLGVLAYVVEGAKHAFDDPLGASVTVDDGDVITGNWATLMVGNLGRLQGGVDLFPESEPDDGLVDLLGLSARTPFENVAAAFQVLGGEGDRLIRSQAKSVKIEFDHATQYQLDGEARPAARQLEFQVEPGALNIRIPRRSS